MNLIQKSGSWRKVRFDDTASIQGIFVMGLAVFAVFTLVVTGFAVMALG